MLCLLLFSAISIYHVSAVDSSELTIVTDKIFIAGSEGSTFTSSIEIINSNLTEDATVHMLYDALGLNIVPETVSIDANDSTIVGIFYVFQETVLSGNISFAWEGLDLRATVNITKIGEEAPEEPEQTIEVDYFPKPPKSGGNIAIYFTGTNSTVSASGFLYCNGYVYDVDMERGFGVVELDRDAYGAATLYLFGDKLDSHRLVRSFEVEKGSEKNLNIEVQSTATIDSEITATVTYGGSPHGNQDVTIENPNDEKEYQTTDNQGKIYFNVDEIGRWKLIATGEGQLATGIINVDYALLALGLAEDIDEDPPAVGDTITIVTEEGAHIEVILDGETIREFTAPADGFISLSLTQGGNYVLKGQMQTKQGEFAFHVPPQAQIDVYDAETRVLAMQVSKEKSYIIEVKDSDGSLLTEAESLWIATPFGTKEYLPLLDGSGTWHPFITGSYLISVDATSKTAETSKHMIVTVLGGLPALEAIVLTFLFIIIIFIVILLVYSKKKGLPFDTVIKSVIRNPLKKKPKLIIPTG